MPKKRVDKPVPGPEAFRKTSQAAIQSQAALLLTLGRQLRGDDEALRARATAAGMRNAVDAIPLDDLAVFPVPTLRPTGERLGVRNVTSNLTARFGPAVAKAPIGGGETRAVHRSTSALAEQLFEEPTTEIAAQLLEASLRHSEELVRVSAASSYFEISTQPQRLIKILADGTRSEDRLVRNVAATALGRVAPENPRLRALTRSRPTKTKKKPSHTSLLVHGTFARTATWWQPGGDFHTFVLANVRPDLYGAATDLTGRAATAMRLERWELSNCGTG